MREEERRFFAAANTENGFYSLFDSVFSPNVFRKIYIIKGGPGTGKSTLMRRIAEDLREKGHECDYYYCSSDSDSLDGIACPALSAAVLDGTAPHATDPVLPGACEKVISLYEMMNVPSLREKKEEIKACKAVSARLYRTAYAYLGAAGRLERDTEMTVKAFWKEEKARAALHRFLRAWDGKMRQGAAETVFSDAVGTKGAVHFDTFEKQSFCRIGVTDRYGAGALLLGELETICSQRKIAAVRIPSPLCPDRLSAFFIRGANVLFTVCRDKAEAEKCDKILNVTRFLDREAIASAAGQIRAERKNKERLVKAAVDTLRKAGEAHRTLEAIYGAQTDFSRYDALEKTVLSDILYDNI